jgi:hypothetical protein
LSLLLCLSPDPSSAADTPASTFPASRFVRGAIFANVVLADELKRTPPAAHPVDPAGPAGDESRAVRAAGQVNRNRSGSPGCPIEDQGSDPHV